MPPTRGQAAAAALAAGAACAPALLFAGPGAPSSSGARQPALRAAEAAAPRQGAWGGAAVPLAVAAAAGLTLPAGRARDAARRGAGPSSAAATERALAAAERALAAAEEAAAAVPPPPFDPSTQLGAIEPLGFFDPAGFSKVGDEEGFRNLRAAELKHGRVAMLAALGLVVQQYVKFPGFEGVPAGVGALTTLPGACGFAALITSASELELNLWKQDPAKEVGDFGDPWGASNIFGYSTDMRQKELSNGRFAMIAAIGILSAELLTGKVGTAQFG